MNWFERRLEWVRSLNPLIVDGALAVMFTIAGIATVFTQEVDDGMVEPTAFAVFTSVITCAPLVIRRREPLLAVLLSCGGILWHIALNYPEGTLPMTVLLLTYAVAAWSPLKQAVIGLGAVDATILLLAATNAPGLGTVDVVGNLALFTGAWAVGIALRARRETIEARVREAEKRTDLERQRSARLLAEERLRIAQELHDVVAHSMSVIAVQAGVGAHVINDRPDDARAALDAISATSRGALAEMRRLLGVLRDADGERSHEPAPSLADVPQLVADVSAAGVPVSLQMLGTSTGSNPAVELSAYRVVQEALTNVIKHAGTPTRVDVIVHQQPGSLTIEVVDEGRGAAAPVDVDRQGDGSGHGLIGMRERVDVWGGQLSVGPVAGGGYKVRAELPYGEDA